MTQQADMINQGATVKGAPGTNAYDLIMQAESLPMAMPSTALVTPIVPETPAGEPPAVTPNTMPIQQESKAGPVILVAAGLGAIYLLTQKNTVGAISGKNKPGKKKSSMLPILLVGGAAAAYLYYKNSNPAADSTAPGSDTTANNTPPPPPPPQGIVFTPATLPTTDSAIYNQLFNYSVPWRYAVDRMTTEQRKTLYLYVYGYIVKHLRLYNFPGSFPDGNYDPVLYAAVTAIENQWHLGLLN